MTEQKRNIIRCIREVTHRNIYTCYLCKLIHNSFDVKNYKFVPQMLIDNKIADIEYMFPEESQHAHLQIEFNVAIRSGLIDKDRMVWIGPIECLELNIEWEKSGVK